MRQSQESVRLIHGESHEWTSLVDNSSTRDQVKRHGQEAVQVTRREEGCNCWNAEYMEQDNLIGNRRKQGGRGDNRMQV